MLQLLAAPLLLIEHIKHTRVDNQAGGLGRLLQQLQSRLVAGQSRYQGVLRHRILRIRTQF